MNVSVPVYIECIDLVYHAQDLCGLGCSSRHSDPVAVLKAVRQKLDDAFTELAAQADHGRLAAAAHAPVMSEHFLRLTIEIDRERKPCRLLFITVTGPEMRVAFTPSVPGLCFTVADGESLAERAEEALAQHFQAQKKLLPPSRPFVVPTVKGRAWVARADLTIDELPATRKEAQDDRVSFGTRRTFSGHVELKLVGRCLDRLYPDELERVVAREGELAELQEALDVRPPHSVLIVGARGVGKTALIHEYVHGKIERYGQGRRRVWHISPQRLIAGMSIVGQWQDRLHAILEAAKAYGEILYFDDLLGLFKAGNSASSRLNAAQVLKPFVERGAVTVLGEITPEALQVLQEVDRGFADLFQVIVLRTLSDAQNERVLIRAMQHLEAKWRCRFAIDVLPAVIDLQRRYARDTAFPGSACRFLSHLAVKFGKSAISRATVLEEFHALSGFSVSFLDAQAKLKRADVVAALANSIIGQDAAVQAAADAITVAKAGLNDPNRPLASFLFLGPTGVGKTQCAKAVAAYIYGSEEKLLRFDMNEYVEPYAAARLVGSFLEPEGLLTSAVRRQPFAVVLLDEIEKAHPDVFDLLLQLMGDGRLTDALGRTVDFTHVILIMTSNLGVREAGTRPGFNPERDHASEAYLKAAERFFRPELFNRLDRVIPFHSLARSDVRRIADLLIRQVFEREGLVRRKIVLDVAERALERVVDEGYRPQLGARALKRALERQLIQPIASQLAAVPPVAPAVISILPGRTGIVPRMQPLVEAVPVPWSVATFDAMTDASMVLLRIERALVRLQAKLAACRPREAITADSIRPEHWTYFAAREQLDLVAAAAHALRDGHEGASPGGAFESLSAQGVKSERLRRADSKTLKTVSWGNRRVFMQELAAAQDVDAFLSEIVAAAEGAPGDEGRNRLRALLRELAFLEVLVHAASLGGNDRVLIHFCMLGHCTAFNAHCLYEQLKSCLAKLGCGIEVPEDKYPTPLIVTGPCASILAAGECGTHLFCGAGTLGCIQVKVFPLAADEDAGAFTDSLLVRRERWMRAIAEGTAAPDGDPRAPGPVVRIYGWSILRCPVIDLGSGHATREGLLVDDLRMYILSRVPLPPELWEPMP